MSLYWRVLLVNAGVLAAGTLVLALSRASAVTDVAVLIVGVVAMLSANLVLLRPVFAPLEDLVRRMRVVDPLRPGARVPLTGGGEVGELQRAFNEMLRRLEDERRESGSRALLAQEAERLRIAQGLHDEVGQTMTGVLFQLKRLSEVVAAEHRDEVAEAQQTVREGLEEVRRIAQELRPEMLEHLGLSSALAALGASFERRTGIAVRRRIAPDLPQLDAAVELALYRVAQEALTNVARHAGARAVDVVLMRRSGDVVLVVTDDGRGLDAAAPEGGGLRGIRERALMIGGGVRVTTRAGGGAEVRLRVPVDATPVEMT